MRTVALATRGLATMSPMSVSSLGANPTAREPDAPVANLDDAEGDGPPGREHQERQRRHCRDDHHDQGFHTSDTRARRSRRVNGLPASRDRRGSRTEVEGHG